jgi:hypothetical protein
MTTAETAAEEREWLDMDAMTRTYPWPRATLYSWRHKGIGPPSVRAGRGVLDRRRDVESWLSDQMAAQGRRYRRANGT